MSDTHAALARFEATFATLKTWGRRALVVLLALAVLALLLSTVVNVETSRLWFGSLHLGSVYTTILRTKILLFALFGGFAGAATAASLWAVRRFQPSRRADEERQKLRWRFQQGEHRWRWVLLGLAGVVPAVVVGSRAAGRWQTWLLWEHAKPWGVADPQFHRDVSYYVSVYPFHRMVVDLLTQGVTIAAVVAVVAAYLYGGWRLRGTGPRLTRPLVGQLSLLGGLYLLLQAGGYWLDRFGLSTSQRGAVTGPSWTDVHAVIAAKTLLVLIAVVLALLLLANVALRRLRLLVMGAVVMIGASLLIGSAWPSLVQRFREQPSASTLELPYIARNQKATLDAFGLRDQVTSTPYDATKALHGSALQQQARRTAQIRLLDPNRLSPTFNVKQQLQAYYGFKSTLDIDHYDLDGTPRDVAIAVRELQVGRISRPTWANSHLVYTHGYGVVAAPTDALDGTTNVPEFLDAGLPPSQEIPVSQPEIYFGQHSPSYSIVGQPAGSTKQLEFDHPGTEGNPAQHTTYAGGGGVAIDSQFRRLLYALKLRSPNILLSNEVNSGSRLLTVRDPRARIGAVAPWLTLDGDVYPAVVGGHIQWVVDGYTTSNTYPDSQLVNLRTTTDSTLTTNGASARQPGRMVNYLRDSVKATVDAYTGEVHLYEWNQDNLPDPLLSTWEAAFPGLVEPQSSIPADLLTHLRYPQNLFDVQRSLLTKYHVTDAADFYSGNDFWQVPTDPTVAATKQLNSTGAATKSPTPTQPSVYMSLSPDGFGAAEYSLSTPLVTLNRRNLAAFLSVNSEPGPDYGKFTLLEVPAGAAIEAPSQVQNDIESTTTISEALTLQRGGNSKVVLGNLLSIPLGGKMLYIEPVYTQATGSNSFPILRHIIATYGDGEPAFETTLGPALQRAVAQGDVG